MRRSPAARARREQRAWRRYVKVSGQMRALSKEIASLQHQKLSMQAKVIAERAGLQLRSLKREMKKFERRGEGAWLEI